MAEFPHLKLPIKVEGVAKPIKGGGGNKPQEQTLQNRNNRSQHGQQLATSANALLNSWYSQVQENEDAGFNIPNKEDIPVFIEIDTNTFNVDSLRNWGIELISEEEGGFIIGASFDKLELFQKNLGQFIEETGRYRNSAAQIWSFAADNTWRLENIVKGPLRENWGNITDNQTYDNLLAIGCQLLRSSLLLP